jgi:hypothetical protein
VNDHKENGHSSDSQHVSDIHVKNENHHNNSNNDEEKKNQHQSSSLYNINNLSARSVTTCCTIQ